MNKLMVVGGLKAGGEKIATMGDVVNYCTTLRGAMIKWIPGLNSACQIGSGKLRINSLILVGELKTRGSMKIGKNASRGCSLYDNQKSYRQMDTRIKLIMSYKSRYNLNKLANFNLQLENGGESVTRIRCGVGYCATTRGL